MFLTKERYYAIRMARALCNMEKQSVKSLAIKECVPIDFAYKIMKRLENGGVAYSTRGKNGGYRLSRSPDKISMFDIMVSIDTRLFISGDIENRSRDITVHCRVAEEYRALQDRWLNSLQDKTLDTLA